MVYNVKYIILSITLLFLLGCSQKEYIPVKPYYTILPESEIPSKTKNTSIGNGCLYIDDRNTHLCGDDLVFVLDVIKRLRTSNERCSAVIKSYNLWAKENNKKRDQEIADEDKK